MNFIPKLISFALLGMMASSVFAKCVEYTPAIKGMAIQQDELILNDSKASKKVPISYRVADDNREKSAGFQHVCSRTIEKEQILFVFDKPFVPNFHMNNVWGLIDIAFIDEDGIIVDVQTMQPYYIFAVKKPTYSPPMPIMFALEARQGFFDEMGVIKGETRLASLAKY